MSESKDKLAERLRASTETSKRLTEQRAKDRRRIEELEANVAKLRDCLNESRYEYDRLMLTLDATRTRADHVEGEARGLYLDYVDATEHVCQRRCPLRRRGR